MIQSLRTRALLVVPALIGMVVLGPASGAQAAQSESAGKTRTYYVAAVEMNWDYAPSGRDEAMGMPFDEIAKLYTESGPHRIGRVYKKAIYREYTDATFSTLKVASCRGAISRSARPGFARRSRRHDQSRLQK